MEWQVQVPEEEIGRAWETVPAKARSRKNYVRTDHIVGW
jgi:hypothetical protein